MRRLSLFLLLSILSVGLLAACGVKEEESLEESSVEESDNIESLAASDTGVEEIDEAEDLNGDTGMEIPEEFPSDYPILDNYTVIEAAAYGPDSLTGELVQVTLKYDDTDRFSEAIDLYKDFYESDGYETEFIVEHGEVDQGEGTFDLKATTEEKAHFCVISKLPNDDFFTVEFSIRNKVSIPN